MKIVLIIEFFHFNYILVLIIFLFFFFLYLFLFIKSNLKMLPILTLHYYFIHYIFQKWDMIDSVRRQKNYYRVLEFVVFVRRSRIHPIRRTIMGDENLLMIMCNWHPEDCHQGNDPLRCRYLLASILTSMTCSVIQLSCITTLFSPVFVNRNALKRVRREWI